MAETVKVLIPSLGESVSEATVACITKDIGESINVDELLIELETDKVTLEVNSPVTGVIKSISIAEGDTVVKDQLVIEMEAGEGAAPAPSATQQTSAPATNNNGPVTSPAANRVINETGKDAGSIQGTGKNGVITKEDALKAGSASSGSQGSTQTTDLRGENVIRMSKLRQVIAKRLKDSQNTAAILTTFNEVDMKPVMDLRKKYQDTFIKKHGVKLGFMSFFIKAATQVLKEIPAVNAEIRGTDIVYKDYADIGVAVGGPNGLVVPVIRNAEQMSCADLENQIIAFGKKAKDGTLTMQEMQGGTFTISNGGVYGSLLSTPIINPPQSGILGMHSIQERPVVVDGKIEIRPMMYLALSYDHRIIDGKEAVTFLVRIKQLLEDPARLFIDV